MRAHCDTGLSRDVVKQMRTGVSEMPCAKQPLATGGKHRVIYPRFNETGFRHMIDFDFVIIKNRGRPVIPARAPSFSLASAVPPSSSAPAAPSVAGRTRPSVLGAPSSSHGAAALSSSGDLCRCLGLRLRVGSHSTANAIKNEL